MGKSAPDRFEMTAAPQSANSPADGPCYFKEKKRAQRSIIGSTPRYPSHRVTKPESWTMAPAPRWCGWSQDAHRQPKSTLEVREEDHALLLLRPWPLLAVRQANAHVRLPR